jgi:molybdopterin molybdotransferase
MTMKPFKELMPREEAQRIIKEKIKQIKRVEQVHLDELNGRVLAKDAQAMFNVPPFDRSSMDGYAVKAVDTAGAIEKSPIRLKLIGAQHTGKIFDGEIKHGECLEIATGSPMPPGSDATVMVEDTIIDGEWILIHRSVRSGRNMAPEGEDIVKGDIVVKAGEQLTPGKIGALAALGYEKAEVFVKPRVAIYSTGPEIVPQGTPLEPGQIYDINSYTLTSVIKSSGGIPFKRSIVSDTKEAIREAIFDASTYDIGVFSGGSSVGVKDLFGDVMEELGEVFFHGLRVKPGKPTLFGMVKGTPIFGMPGYPTSCLNNSYVYLAPAVRQRAGLLPNEERQLEVKMAERLESKSDREQFITVRVENNLAYRVFKQSGDITSMTHADGYIILPIGKNTVEKGETITVTLLN